MPLIVNGRRAQCPGLSFSSRGEGGCLICFAAGCFGLGGKTGPAALCQGLEATLATTSKDVPRKEPDTPRSTLAPLRQTHKYIHEKTEKVFMRPGAKGGSCHVIWGERKKRKVGTNATKEEKRFRVTRFVVALVCRPQQHVGLRPDLDQRNVGKAQKFHQTVLFLPFISVYFGLPVYWRRLPASGTVRAPWRLIVGGGGGVNR